MLQAELCEPRVALTRRLYGTVAVMSSVMSHSGSLVGEQQLLGIQMWLTYRVSYSLAKERKAQHHNCPFYPGSVMVASNCLIHLHFMGQQNKQLLHTPIPTLFSVTNHPFFLIPFVTRQRKLRHKPQCIQVSPSPGSPSQSQPLPSLALLSSPDFPISTPDVLQTIQQITTFVSLMASKALRREAKLFPMAYDSLASLSLHPYTCCFFRSDLHAELFLS